MGRVFIPPEWIQKELGRYSDIRKVDVCIDPRMSQAIRKFHFYTAWAACDRQMAFEVCNQVRKYCGLDPYSHEKFDNAYQYRTIFSDSYRKARDEFFNLCFGWW
jgi:hypothetical protein